MKRGGYFNPYIVSAGAKFVKEAKTRDLSLFIVKGLYPHVIEKESNIDTCGEIYEADASVLNVMDQIEGHPNFYIRKKINIDGDECWVYMAPKAYSGLNVEQISSYKV